MCVCVWGGGGLGGEGGVGGEGGGGGGLVVGVRWGGGDPEASSPRKIVKFRLPEMPFCAFSDEIDSKLNDPPTPRYPALPISS